ncbi:MAG TPA: TIGR02757 family protein [Bdellovibrionota bacterium]|nr:TIGR02757 family protein [Bdellovibrionota bacterium]
MGKIRATVFVRPESVNSLRPALDRLASHFDERFLHTDPLKFPHRYTTVRDRELVGFVSALLAFGNVRTIFQSLESLLQVLGSSPYETVYSWPNKLPKRLRSFRHRWVTGQDLHFLFKGLRRILRKFGSIERVFMAGYAPGDLDLSKSLERFSHQLLSEIHCRSPDPVVSLGLRFLISTPVMGSGCKRLNLFLRWMVRRVPPDLGIWKAVPPRQLLLPIDTHLGRILQYIGLTARRTVGWKMVSEVTARLRELDPEDPVRFDFALARLGILNRCRHRPDPDCCPHCLLRELCVLNNGTF